MAKISPYARRWSLKEKNFFLHVYLASPRAYSILYKYFKFPSKRTLQKSISGIEIQTGFIAPVLNALKLVVEKMNPHNKLCNIVFDEVT